MSEIKRVKIQNFLETQIPEFLNVDNPLFKEFLEQYYISLEHQTGTVDIANNLVDYKRIDNFNAETFYTQNVPCILTQDSQFFDTTIYVNHTIGFPDRYGLIKIGNEIISYSSKTINRFEECVRGFSGIDKISNKNFYGDFNFIDTNAEDHSVSSVVQNLNVKFFDELFRKFRYQFLPGFENRKIIPEINLQTLLSRAKDFYVSKGTDTSYKILFKILFDEDVEIIKPQDYMLRPSDNKFFVTKNILVEKVLGISDPLDLVGETLYQNTESGLASASIYNVEIRPISNNRFLYEISLDPESFILNFKSTKKTNIMEDADSDSTTIIVDSTVGFPESGQLLVQSINAPSPFVISYEEKTINQFLGVSGGIVNLSENDVVIENEFAFCDLGNDILYFRIINVIKDLDYSNTSNMRVDDNIKLSSFGVELESRIEFNKWLYNIPTSHNIRSITSTAEQNTWRVVLEDSIKLNLGQEVTLTNPEDANDIKSTATLKRVLDLNAFELISGDNLSNKLILKKTISKSNVLFYPEANNLISNIQNTYIDGTEENLYVTSSGLPDYRVNANDRKIVVVTPQNPNPTLGAGTTTILNTNVPHRFYSGEKVYFTSTENLGISTGIYFVTALGNYSNSNQISLSYSNSDTYSGKYVEVSYGGLGEFVKLDYEFKTLEHQKLLRKFPLDNNSSEVDDVEARDTNNKPIGLLLNGVELYSSTLYDENLYYGKIDSIDVVSGGTGYDVINNPQIEINDNSGFGAKVHLNISGEFKDIKVVSPGFGYSRDFSINIIGGNGVGAAVKPNIVKTRVNSGFRGDGTGVNPTDNSISFVLPHNFDDGEQIEYISNSNREIEYSDPVTGQIRKIPSNSFYFAGVISEYVIKLYRTKEDAANKINEINLTTSPSSGFHYFRSLNSRLSLVSVSIESGGSGYSNKKVIIPSSSDNFGKQNGIDVYEDTIFAKGHNLNPKDIIVYSTTGTSISGLSTTSKYHVNVIDQDRFKLCLAGTGNNINDSNYNNNKFIRLNSVGVGTHTFAYPPIELVIEASPETSNGKLELPILEPIVTGTIDSIFIENQGEKYGTDKVINYHRRPNILINNIQSEALFKPVIIDGKIIDVQILSYGNGYGKDVDLFIYGSGKFAEIYPVVSNGRISSVVVLNGGVGYDSNTTILARPRGSGAKFLANVFEWKINQVQKNKFLLEGDDEGILVPSKNQQNGLQFIHFFPPKVLRKKLDDNITITNAEEENPNPSPILGWAYDGHPIYGPYTNIENSISRVRSSYIKDIETNSNFRPTGVDFPDGFFVQDYVFDKEYGNLDEYNGRFIKNSDFPNGTYAYFYTIDVDNNRNSFPQYPYILARQFKNLPNSETYSPNYNQNLNLGDLGLIRNTSPYYLNSKNSNYGLLDSVQDELKQEFIVKSITKSGITSIVVYAPGDGYRVGEVIDVDNSNSGGTGVYASISEIKGKNIDSLVVGIATYYPVNFIKIGDNIIGEVEQFHTYKNNETIIISSISSPKFKHIEGPKKINVYNKTVGIITDILDLNATGSITKIYPRDIINFSVDDYIKIDEEVLKVLNVLPEESALRVERIENTGVHTSPTSVVELLPRRFSFTDVPNSLVSIPNTRVYFDAEQVVGYGNTLKLANNNIITIPEQTVYIPDHQFHTGQPLTYHPGIDGINLTVLNYPGGPQFQLGVGQTVYAVNFGKDLLGITTVAYAATVGIGTTYSSLFFSSAVSGVGIAHSFTTQLTQIQGKVESYSIIINSEQAHGLEDEDLISLNFIPELETTIKFRYDDTIRKITTDLILFDSSLVDTENSTLHILEDELKTGDAVVYYNGGNSSIGGLENNRKYFVIKDSPDKIKLANYYSDALSGSYISITAVSTGNHSLAKINPNIKVTKGSYVTFDLTDSSLTGLNLRLYKDSNFTKELESYNYISNNEKYLRTSLDVYPRQIYYSFNSSVFPIYSDVEVKNGSLIEIVDSDYVNSYNIKVLNSNSFQINLPNKPESTDYTELNVNELRYSTKSANSTGPIEKIKLNYGGIGYNRIPRVSNIITQSGKNATLKARTDKIGRISLVERVKDGFDYPTDATLLPLMGSPAILEIEGISRVGSVGIITGGRNYNTKPTLKVIGNDNIKLDPIVQGSSIVKVDIVENVNNLSSPLRIVPIRNSNGYSIDDISIAGNLVTLELLNSDVQLYPLINVGYGSSSVVFPFEVGDEIFIERCRLSTTETGNIVEDEPKDNYNSSNYGYRFFTVVGINTTNYTVTYSMEGISDNLGEYTSDFGYGIVVNRRDMAEFEMVVANDLSYMSNEKVYGYNRNNVNTFSATVMNNGWDNELNQLRVFDVKGALSPGDRLDGEISLLKGQVTDVNIFNLRATLDVTRDKINDLGDRIGYLNDFQQRISDNNYYQKFSYSIKGKIPYNVWREPVKSIIHPSGFKEFSDLSVVSISTSMNRVGTASSLELTVNVDNYKSTYTRNNFAIVTEDEQFEDGSIERIVFEEGTALKPYLLSKTNKVIIIDDISPQFDGASNFEVIANKAVTFVSNNLYQLGVNTSGLAIGDRIGYSTYHYYPDSTYILTIGQDNIGISSDSPHKLYPINGIATSVTQNLDFYRRIPGDRLIGISSFRLTSEGDPLFLREFDASNGITTTINLTNDSFTLPNHNFQTGQKIIYTPETAPYTSIASTTVDIAFGYSVETTFDSSAFSLDNNQTWLATFDYT